MKKFILTLLLCLLTTSVFADNGDGGQNKNQQKANKDNSSFNNDLFSGIASYGYQFELPNGVKGLTPSLAVTYNSAKVDYLNTSGYGFDLSMESIYRSTKKGNNKLYELSDFSINSSFSNNELIENGSGSFLGLNNNDFNKYTYQNDGWIVNDTKGNTYYFGDTVASRQINPDNDKTFRWHLSKKVDIYGNTIQYSYIQADNNIYLSEITYAFTGNIPLYKVTIDYLEKTFSPISYIYGFKLENHKLFKSVTTSYYNAGVYQPIKTYNLTYTDVETPFPKLKSIEEISGTQTRDHIRFEYYTSGIGIHLMKSIDNGRGLVTGLEYKSSALYQNTTVPFIIKTLYKVTFSDSSTGLQHSKTYDYYGGNFYFDPTNIYNRGYTGFSKVKIIDDDGRYEMDYFHQSDTDKNNPTDSQKGEYQDHISKKGRIYRQEIYNLQDEVEKTIITQYTHTSIGNGRYIVNKTRDVEILKNGTSKATEYTYDSFANPLTSTLYGSVTVSNAAGDFTDIGTDKRVIESTYINDTTTNLIGFPVSQVLKDNLGNIASKKEFFYDQQALGMIIKGELTKERVYTSSTEYFDSQKQYNTQGLVIKTINPRGYEQNIVYDVYGLYPIQVTNAKGWTESYEYDYAFGQPTKHNDVNGLERRFEYDNFGRPMRESVVLGTTDTTLKLTSYDDASIPNKVYQKSYYDTGTNDSVESYTYLDAQGNVIQSKQKYQDKYVTTKLKYDSRGNTVYTTYPTYETGSGYTVLNQTVEKGDNTQYDALDRVKQISNASGNITYTYNDTSFTLTNQKGVSHSYHYDLFGNLVKVIEPGNLETVYSYSPAGNLTQITDALGNIRHISYDLAGRRLEIEDLHSPTDTNFGKQSYIYDANGNVLSQTVMSGDVISYTYDELDRPTQESLTGETTNFTYDSGAHAKGQLTSYTKGTYSESYSYNTLGQKITDTKNYNGTAYTQGYSYTLGGQVKTIEYPDSKVTTYVYGDGVLLGVSYDGVALTTGIEYNEALKIKELQYGNGAEDVRNYDYTHGYRLASKTLTSSGQTLSNLGYTFDAVGNIAQLTESGNQLDFQKTVDYTYDNLNRLTNATYDFATGATLGISYSYDALGNILTNSEVGNYTYTDQGRNNPHAVSVIANGSEAIAYTYDDNGNIDNETYSGSITTTYTYNPKNELLSSQIGTGAVTSYEYNSNGIRSQKITDTKLNRYINKEYEVEINGVGTGQTIETNKYIFLGTDKLATIKKINTNTEDIIYHYSDHLGSASIDIDENGDILEQVDYKPFGEVRKSESSLNYANKYRFIGKEQDTETELQYFEARYYSNQVGRFRSVDTMFWLPGSGDEKIQSFLWNPQKQNSYSYSGNNPIIYVDNDGQWRDIAVNYVTSALGWTYGKATGDVYLQQGAKTLAIETTKEAANPTSYVTKKIKIAGKALNLAQKELPKIVETLADKIAKISRSKLGRPDFGKIQNERMYNIMKNAYKDQSTVGNGGVADAIREELVTGEPVGGRWHSIKGRETINGLKNLLKKGVLNEYETKVANDEINDIKNAFNGK